jgi:hypothetical protein
MTFILPCIPVVYLLPSLDGRVISSENLDFFIKVSFEIIGAFDHYKDE